MLAATSFLLHQLMKKSYLLLVAVEGLETLLELLHDALEVDEGHDPVDPEDDGAAHAPDVAHLVHGLEGPAVVDADLDELVAEAAVEGQRDGDGQGHDDAPRNKVKLCQNLFSKSS